MGPQNNPGEITQWPMLKIAYRTDADKIAALLPPGIECHTCCKHEPHVVQSHTSPVLDPPHAKTLSTIRFARTLRR